ncbi:hypothetical protein MBANPS3_004915 [Mucor bainieri]
MSDELDDFTGTGTALSYPVPCSTLKKGSYVVIQERPCKITDMSTSRKDEHGRIKIHLVGIDIFTGKKYEIMSSSTGDLDVPNITYKD